MFDAGVRDVRDQGVILNWRERRPSRAALTSASGCSTMVLNCLTYF